MNKKANIFKDSIKIWLFCSLASALCTISFYIGDSLLFKIITSVAVILSPIFVYISMVMIFNYGYTLYGDILTLSRLGLSIIKLSPDTYKKSSNNLMNTFNYDISYSKISDNRSQNAIPYLIDKLNSIGIIGQIMDGKGNKYTLIKYDISLVNVLRHYITGSITDNDEPVHDYIKQNAYYLSYGIFVDIQPLMDDLYDNVFNKAYKVVCITQDDGNHYELAIIDKDDYEEATITVGGMKFYG